MVDAPAVWRLISFVDGHSVDRLTSPEQARAAGAVVARFQYPTPIKGTPHTPREWVEQRFQFVTAENAADLPDAGGDSDVSAPQK